MFVDSHCHLHFEDFNEDLLGIIERYKKSGIVAIQNICTKISEFDKVYNITKLSDNIFCSYGIHPHEVENEIKIDVNKSLEIVNNPKIIGIGETGLDYYYEHSPKKLQIESFNSHIEIARISGLPIIIHTRDADEDCLAILTEQMKYKEFKALIHCFTASEEFAKSVLDLGIFISISGIVTFKNATNLQNIVKALPIDKILIETDSPYLAPIPYRGKRCEPSFVVDTAKFIANLRGEELDYFAKKTTDNFFKLFDKAEISI